MRIYIGVCFKYTGAKDEGETEEEAVSLLFL